MLKRGELLKLLRCVEQVVFDFDGVFTDNRVWVSQDGEESVVCNRSDGIGLVQLQKLGIRMFVLSKERNPVVSVRCRKLNIDCHQGCDDKLAFLKEKIKGSSVEPAKVVYMGNDINDMECMDYVGIPVAVADAYPEVARTAVYVTERKGGYGAVREICDLICESKQ